MFLKLAVLLKALSSLVTAYQWPNYALDEPEHLLVDTDGFNDGGFKRAITPCTNYADDFTTANITAGTGGIDASIQFETGRPENSGAAMNDSMGFFSPFANAHVSMADLIALSVVISVGGCSSPILRIPLRGGRIDAIEGGETSVPEPESSLEDTLRNFRKNRIQSALTICRHTMGSVRHAGFPQVGRFLLSVTIIWEVPSISMLRLTFSTINVHEYLNWEGQRGRYGNIYSAFPRSSANCASGEGALVTTENITVRSDLRLFTSDNNATIQRLATSSDYFKQSCVDLFTRMIDTVPSNVHLTEVITPNAVKPVNVSLILDNNGGVVFSGYIRFSDAVTVRSSIRPYTTYQLLKSLRISWLPEKSTATASLLHTGGSLFGRDTMGTGIIPGLLTTTDTDILCRTTSSSCQDLSSIDEDGNIVIKAAVLTSTNPVNVSAKIAVPTRMIGALGPRIDYIVVQLSPEESLGAYTIYGASTSVESMHADQTTVDIVASYDGVITSRSDKFLNIVLMLCTILKLRNLLPFNVYFDGFIRHLSIDKLLPFDAEPSKCLPSILLAYIHAFDRGVLGRNVARSYLDKLLWLIFGEARYPFVVDFTAIPLALLENLLQIPVQCDR
ncbi:heme peroxidase [Armillaria mellea]|nr:heme peroxidase [Armillaria mellea]